MVDEDKLKRTENIWDTSGLYSKTFLFPKAIEHDIFDKQIYAYKARVKHARADYEPSLATAIKLPDWPHTYTSFITILITLNSKKL